MSRPKRNRQKREARRKVVAGFPISPRPFTAKEVEDYLSKDRIQCLICGRLLKRIGGLHLNIHDISVDEYKDMYGLPYTRGLTSAQSNKAYSDAAKLRIKNGWDPTNGRSKEDFVNQTKNAARRPERPFNTEKKTTRGLAHHGLKRSWQESDFKPILLYALENTVSLPTAFKNHPFKQRPPIGAMHKHFMDNPELKKWFHGEINKLDFKSQIQMRRGLMDSFWKRVVEHRVEGLSDKKIGAIYSIDAMTINIGRRRRGIK